MTLPITLFLSLALAAAGADESWTKVRALPSGTELRVMKKGVRQPVMVRMDEATFDTLRAVLKNEQVSIAKDDIDQIDFRPKEKARKMVTETRNTVDDPAGKVPGPAAPQPARVPSASSSSNVIFGSKPEFETIYRRVPTLRPVQ